MKDLTMFAALFAFAPIGLFWTEPLLRAAQKKNLNRRLAAYYKTWLLMALFLTLGGLALAGAGFALKKDSWAMMGLFMLALTLPWNYTGRIMAKVLAAGSK